MGKQGPQRDGLDSYLPSPAMFHQPTGGYADQGVLQRLNDLPLEECKDKHEEAGEYNKSKSQTP